MIKEESKYRAKVDRPTIRVGTGSGWRATSDASDGAGRAELADPRSIIGTARVEGAATVRFELRPPQSPESRDRGKSYAEARRETPRAVEGGNEDWWEASGRWWKASEAGGKQASTLGHPANGGEFPLSGGACRHAEKGTPRAMRERTSDTKDGDSPR